MGTTLTAVVPDGNGVLVGHVGDSRAYLLRDGELRQLTTDHSLVEELMREGTLTEEQAATHPQRSVITRALGVEESVEVDVYPVPLVVGDRLLICSDGLTSMLRPDAIGGLLRRESDPTRAANLLVDAANAAGGEDNITTVVIDIEDDGADPFAPSPASVGAAVTVAAPMALPDSPSDVGTDVHGGAPDAPDRPGAATAATPVTERPTAAVPPVNPAARTDRAPPTRPPPGSPRAHPPRTRSQNANVPNAARNATVTRCDPPAGLPASSCRSS